MGMVIMTEILKHMMVVIKGYEPIGLLFHKSLEGDLRPMMISSLLKGLKVETR